MSKKNSLSCRFIEPDRSWAEMLYAVIHKDRFDKVVPLFPKEDEGE